MLRPLVVIRIAWLASLVACASPPPLAVSPVTAPPPPPVALVAPAPPEATMLARFTHTARDTWTVEYVFSSPVSAVAFGHTRISRDGWRITEPSDATRTGAIVSAPRPFVRLAFELPTAFDQPEKEYAPFYRYSDRGALAYTGQLSLARVACESGHCDWGSGLSVGELLSGTMKLVAGAGESVVVNGESPASERAFDVTSDGTYAYFGDLVPVETPAAIGVLDHALPDWLHARIAADIPRMLGLFADRLGPLDGAKPTVYLTFAAIKRGYSFGGGVLPPHVLSLDLELGPDLLSEKNTRTRAKVDELIAHEAAHFWNGGKYTHSGDATAAWMHEGTADAMAFRALRLTGTFDEAGYRDRLSEAASECALWLNGGAGLRATQGGHSRAFYVCGSTFDLVAEAAQKRHDPSTDLFTFWNAVFAEGKPTYEEAQFFQVLDRVSGDPTLSAVMRHLLHERDDDPVKAIRGLLASVGLTTTLKPSADPMPPAYDEMASVSAVTSLVSASCLDGLTFVGDVAATAKVTKDGACGAPSLIKGDRIDQVEGVLLGAHGATAYARGYASCVARKSFEITTKSGVHARIACKDTPAAPPPYFRLVKVP